MNPPGTVLLVSCYELGRQPLALAWPAAFLRRAGFDVEVVDLSIDSLDSNVVSRARACLVATPMHTALRLGIRAVEEIRRRHPACAVGFFGSYAALNARHLLDSGLADACFAGEAEENMVGWVRAVFSGETPVPGVQRALTKLAFPVPDRRGLRPLSSYAQLEYRGQTQLVGTVESSRGCRHVCTHCPLPAVFAGRYFAVPQEIVVSDVRQLVEAGARHLSFGDPDFLNAPVHALRVARAIHEEFPELTFDFTAKIQHLLVHGKTVEGLAALGALFVVSAAESLNPAVLRTLEKDHTAEDIALALARVRDVGLTLRPTWLPFTPWSTRRDFWELLDFLDEHDLVPATDPVQLSIRLLVPPGSLLENAPAFLPHRGPFDAQGLSWAWSHPEPGMDILQRDLELAAGSLKGTADFVTCARRLSGAPVRAGVSPGSPASAARPPRLTEEWFC